MVQVVRPEDWSHADMVEAESDALDNALAIMDIDDWAARNGLIRADEHWLAAIRRADGKTVRRSMCYRPA